MIRAGSHSEDYEVKHTPKKRTPKADPLATAIEPSAPTGEQLADNRGSNQEESSLLHQLQLRLKEVEAHNRELRAAVDGIPHEEFRRSGAELEERVTLRTEQLQNSRNHLRTILDNLPMLVWLKDCEGRFLTVNRFLAESSHKPLESIIGLTDLDLWPRELAEAYRADDREVMASRSRKQKEERVVTNSGPEWHETFKVPLQDAQGNVIGTMGISREITERRSLQEKLQQSHALLQELTDQVPGIIYQYRFFPDGRSCFPFASRNLQELYGIAPEEICEDAAPLLALIHPDDYECLLDSIRLSAQSLQPWQLEFRAFLPLQGERWLCGDAKPQRLTDGSTLWHGYISDITQRKQAEEELHRALNAAQSANRSKSEFLANMSHEIRTPMNAIVGMGHLLSQTRLTPQQREYLQKIDSSSHLLLEIIDSILDLSSIDAGNLKLEQAEFSLSETLNLVKRLITVRCMEKGLELRMMVEPELPDAVVGDTQRLQQVLLILLGNAVKFTRQGEIGVAVSSEKFCPGDRMLLLRITVSDTGIGLPPEQIPQLFSPFTQGDSSFTRPYGGTGLGLSICKRIVQLMGGEISAEGIPGVGSAFTFTAELGIAHDFQKEPLRPVQEPHAVEKLRRSGALTAEELRLLRGKRVLVVEDQPLNQELMREILERAGMQVSCADNGQEAVFAVTEQGKTFDIILMDLQMPVMDGYKATRRIREQERTLQPPIIALTAHALKEEQELCRQAGMNGHLAKPVNVEELFHSLFHWLFTTQLTGEPPPPSSPCLKLPDHLPGLNLAEGLSRLRCNVELYRRLIIGFCRDRRNVASEIREALTAGDLKRSHALVHALTGVAGNLAITGVYDVARDLGALCSQGDSEGALELLPTLEMKLAEIISSAALLEEQSLPVDASVVSRKCDAGGATALLHELGILAADHNLKSLKTVALLQELLTGSEYAPAAASIEERLERLDFDAAAVKIKELKLLIIKDEPVSLPN